jgi:hypothetical protein
VRVEFAKIKASLGVELHTNTIKATLGRELQTVKAPLSSYIVHLTAT